MASLFLLGILGELKLKMEKKILKERIKPNSSAEVTDCA